MARIDVIIPDKLKKEFEMATGKRLGAKRGAFTEGIIQAMKDWIENA